MVPIDPAVLLSESPSFVVGVRVDLADGTVEMMPARASSKMLRYLWSRYRRRYPDLSHLEARYAKMREVGIELSSTRDTRRP